MRRDKIRAEGAAALYQHIEKGNRVKVVDSVMPFTRRPTDAAEDDPSLALPKLMIFEVDSYRIEVIPVASALFGREGQREQPAVGSILSSGKVCRIGPLSMGSLALSSALEDGRPVNAVQMHAGFHADGMCPELPPTIVLEVPDFPNDDCWHRIDIVVVSCSQVNAAQQEEDRAVRERGRRRPSDAAEAS